MKHLKKFNESVGAECSFEDFKDIMLDLLDDFDFDYDFNDYSDSESFYDCHIYLSGKPEYELHDDIPDMNINFLGMRDQALLPPTDDPEEITDFGLNDCVVEIDNNIQELYELQKNLSEIIRFQEDCKKLFKSLSLVKDRFNNFSNCYKFCIGFNQGELRITFDLKDED